MAEHDIEKIVEAGGEVFNFRDPTKQPVADRVTSWSSTPSDTKYPSEKLVKDSLDGIAGDYRTKDQDISKGANLVVNGSGRMSCNYNFSSFLYIPTLCRDGSAGAFGFNGQLSDDEFISVDFNKRILFSADVKNLVTQSSNCVHRIYVAEYDIDKKAIQPIHVLFGIGTLTELTQDLNPGDTVVHLADLSNSNWQASNAYQRGFIFWNYKNSYGYEYPPETYSRNQYIGTGNAQLYSNANVNASAGTITLDNPWAGPAIPAGTKVSRRQSGNTYPYPAYINNVPDTDWHHIEGVMSGIVEPGTSYRGNKFSQGTAFIKVGMYPSNIPNSDSVTGKRCVVANLAVYELPEVDSTPTANSYKLMTSDGIKTALDVKVGFSDVDAALSTTSTKPLQNKEITRWINLIIGDDGYVSVSSANPQLSLEKVRLGAVSLYNKGVTVKIYSFAENDEANAVLRWDSSAATGDVKTNYDNGLQTGTLYQSSEGEWVKITYTGSTSAYFRAIGIFLDTKDTGTGTTRFRAFVRVNGVDYPQSDIFNTFGSLVVAAYSGTPRGSAEIILKPYNSSSRCRIYGFRCLNTYTGSDDAVLIGTSTNATKLRNARKLAVSLSNTSTDTSFDGSADVTNIKTTGTLGVGNGGTGKTSVTSGSYVVGAGTSAMVEKTPKDVGSDVLSHLDTDNGNVVDDDYIVGSYHVNDTTISSTQFVRRTAVKLWNYIKSKLSGSDVNIGGNAATAGTADTAKAYDTSFSGTNSIASKFGEKQNRVAWDIGADTYNASTNRAATVDSIVKRIAVKPDGFSASVDYTNAVELSIPYSAGPGRVALMCVATTGNGDSVSFQATFVKNANEKLKFVVGTVLASTGTFVSPVLKYLSSDDSSPAQKVVLYIDANVRCNLSCLVAANDGMSSITVTEVAMSTADSYSSLQSWGRLANDSGVVHIDGAETIIGAKEFSRSGQDTNFTDSSGAESIVRARTSSNSNNGSAQIDAYAGGGKFGLYARNASGTGKWVACLGNDGVVNLGSSGDAVRIGGTKFVFGASQLGTDSNTFYWV